MKFAVLLDPLHHLQPYKDTTLAIVKRAQEMGWECIYFTQNDLFSAHGKSYAHCYHLHVNDLTTEHWASVTDLGEKPLADFDIIFMRKDPPFNTEYIYTTYLLELAEKEGVLIVNKPQSLRDANEKFFTLNFPQCSPETLVSKDMKRLRSFWQQHQNVIFKPAEAMGGSSVFHVDEQGRNLSVILEILTEHQTRTIMAQRYIPEIVTGGDKRILIINGEAVPYALARIPAAGELRGNLAAGARGEVVPLTPRDRWIAEQVGPTLKTKGLYFVGIDVIGDFLTEINVTSPTCLQEITAGSGLDIAGDFLHALMLKVQENESRP